MRSSKEAHDHDEAEEQASVQEDISRLDAYRNQLNLILRQQEMLRISLVEHNRARETMENMERLESGAEILAPVGAETFVKVSPVTTGRILIGVGSGIIIEVAREKGLAMVNERIQGLEKADKDMTQELLRLDREAQAISERLENAMGRQGQEE